MFNRFRTLLGATITLAASALDSVNPFRVVSAAEAGPTRGNRGRHGTVAQAKRAATKRRNQLRHKRACRG
jgi:hypothetical protein